MAETLQAINPEEGGHWIRLEDGSLIPDPAYVYKTPEEHAAEEQAKASKAALAAPAPAQVAVATKPAAQPSKE